MQKAVRYLLFVTAGVLLAHTVGIIPNILIPNASARLDNPQTEIPFEELRTFSEVFSRIKNDYVEEVDDKELLENAIRGMLSGLDPHSSYLDTEDFKDLQIGTTGEFGGLGIEVGMENGFVKVIAPIDDTPAQKAGVHSGDLVIRLDETPVKGMTLSEAVKLMRGKPGTEIQLTIVREGEDKPLKITIVRDIIRVKSVKSRMLDDGFGYVRITQFQSKTGEGINKAISKLKKEYKESLKGMVLDLRNNPGGVLNSSVSVSDAFLEKGLIVYTEGRVEDSRLRFNATPGDVINGIPLVVLINGGSASASEIVAGALQDHKRAIIMGTKSFGKGSVQTILPARSGTAVKLTTARYYTPSGRSIQAEGITPDIEVQRATVSSAEKPLIDPLKEKDLTHHLKNGSNKKGKDKEASDSEKDSVEDLASKDYQLFEALNLLKGLYIATQQKRLSLTAADID